ncbi:mobilization protein [Streptomyces pluripotens]|uniref:Mobilization protein n=1 Tax=Streptomyces pluripotens TaxID=1355015 RepID=A0A221P1F5_9ACTN|nr:mobilization protein [Streptomyces pluripotens]ARP71353.1 mobilization protein [Streptomyces pluripotens]ASN25605.1 mobilization protein [Streptomyces pluripotens]
MVPDVSTGDRTRGLLSYLFGPGRRNEHTDPHIVAAFAMPGITDPGRVPLDEHQSALSELAQYLDQPVELRRQRTGKKVPQHVWHCPVRTAPGDRYLTDTEWAEVARRVVHATGIAPHSDDSGCRWIAVRHAEDHIHILATSVREDGRRPRNKGDGRRAQAECRKIEIELGLRRLKSGDGTAPKTPTGAEVAKAERQGRKTTTRQWLREHAYAAAAAARDEHEYFAVLTALGIKVQTRIGPGTGETTGYSLAAPGDTDANDEPIYYAGSTLAPDLSLNRLRERFLPTPADTTVRASVRNGQSTKADAWRCAETELRTTHTFLLWPEDGHDQEAFDRQVQAQAAAFAELLHNTAATAPKGARAELHAAAAAFDRANRSAIRAEHQSAYALRQAGKELMRAVGGEDGSAVVALLATAVYVLIALDHWHQQRGHEQQAAAARQSLTHLQAAYQHTARPVLARLAERTPGPDETRRLAAAVQAVVPEHAQRILTDPAWPALATALAQAESAGTPPRHALTAAAGRRELDSADHPAQVLTWRLRNNTADQTNARTRAATTRTRQATTTSTQSTPTPAAVQRPDDTLRRRR